MSYQLVLIRHGQSVWNEKNLFTGWHDCALSDVGIAEARAAGQHLHALGLGFDLCYTSVLIRAQKTLDLVLEEMGQELPIIADKALNERDYGDLTGLNKDDARKKFGADQIHQWRRSYDIAPPGGESLKMTAERVLPYYKSQILPALLSPKRILISAHGNSLRALIMFIEGLSEQQIINRELATGLPIIYQLDEQGRASGAEKPA